MKNLFPILLILIHVASANAQINIDSSLVACYGFNGNAIDQTGNGYNGIVHGASLTTDRFSNTNSAYEFNSINGEYIELPDDFDFANRTINFWFYANATTGTQKIMYHSDNPDLQYVSTKLYVKNPGNPKLGWEVTSSVNKMVEYTMFENQWNMATLSTDSASFKYYINGNQIANIPFAWVSGSPVGSKRVHLGGSLFFDKFFDGKLDDLTIHNRVLTQQEVSYLFNNAYSCTATSIVEQSNENKVAIYPNPSHGSLTVSLNQGLIHEINILNALGQNVLTHSKMSTKQQTIDVEALKKGIYVIQIKTEANRFISKRLVIE